jgi:hypothetical protein
MGARNRYENAGLWGRRTYDLLPSCFLFRAAIGDLT